MGSSHVGIMEDGFSHEARRCRDAWSRNRRSSVTGKASSMARQRFSGTGNTRNVIAPLLERAERHGMVLVIELIPGQRQPCLRQPAIR